MNIKNLSNSDSNHCVIPFPPIEMFLKENASWKLRIRASWLDFWKTRYKQVINNSLVNLLEMLIRKYEVCLSDAIAKSASREKLNLRR